MFCPGLFIFDSYVMWIRRGDDRAQGIMDILSDVLNVVRLNGGAFYTAEFTSPWAVFTPPADELAVLMGTRAESVAVFHIFVEGECWISLKGTEPFPLSAGSAIIFSHSPSHELASTPGLEPEPIISLLTYPEGAVIPAIKHGGGGSLTRFFCGYLQSITGSIRS